MAGSQKITLWGPQRTPLGILRVKWIPNKHTETRIRSHQMIKGEGIIQI